MSGKERRSEENNNIDDVDDEDVWIQGGKGTGTGKEGSLYKGMKELEQTCRCPICHEFLKVPVSVQPCQHSFCSVCVRKFFSDSLKSLKRAAACPVCRMVMDPKMAFADFTKCLIPNRSMEILVLQYQAVRPALLATLLGSGDERGASKNDTVAVAAVATNIEIPKVNEAAESLRPARKQKRSYHNMKRKQLQELCAAEGLSTAGTPEELKFRLETFIALYNAECDSLLNHRRTHAQLVDDITQQEQARALERQHSTTRSCVQRLYETRALVGQQAAQAHEQDVTTVTSGNEEFDNKMKSNFEKLRQQVQERLRQLKNKQKQDKQESDSAGSNPAADCGAASMDHSPTDSAEEKQSKGLLPTGLQTNTASTQMASSSPTPERHEAPTSNSGTSKISSAEKENFLRHSATSKDASVDLLTLPAPDTPTMMGSIANSTPTSSGSSSSLQKKRKDAGDNKSKDMNLDASASGNEIESRSSKRVKAADDLEGTPNLVRINEAESPRELRDPLTLETANAALAPSNNKNNDTSHVESNPMSRNDSASPLLLDHKRTLPERSSPSSLVGPWTCGMCTFVNHTRTWSRATCEMCESPRHPKQQRQQYDVTNSSDYSNNNNNLQQYNG